ncbi:hypothetical protein NDI76_16305 [Halogeometricum sp. S1BR25-6]|uniref:DUF35 domain-containing protein n=1 Tax=Halogeometricum salsisoli TaxID=2950536 RepID=A0ABU2GJE7_9EURY|nr:hypothetical protein [Halogeometricum sp. S1BR25-6]MDS0300309.1 hypothetical protein [Halogeometricum sp. S1BR25-6]
MREPREEGYDDLLDALESDTGYYLSCPAGHGSLPPRRVCPRCGDDELSEETLPARGTVVTFTEVAVPAPAFAGQTPVVLIADFGPVRLTGELQDCSDVLEVGSEVIPTVVSSSGGNRHVGFRLASEG